jgi:hypothetical protein
MLAETKKNGQRDSGGRGRRIESHDTTQLPQLRDIGISRDQSHQALALEVYARQAQNMEAERKAVEIRLRAERRCGQLLKDMKERGERAKTSVDVRHAQESQPATLTDLGISKTQSSRWQKLAGT